VRKQLDGGSNGSAFLTGGSGLWTAAKYSGWRYNDWTAAATARRFSTLRVSGVRSAGKDYQSMSVRGDNDIVRLIESRGKSGCL